MLRILGIAVLISAAALLYLLPSSLFLKPTPAQADVAANPVAGNTQHAASKNRDVIHILFIGNSFTFTNDIPGMMASIGASDSDVPWAFDIQSSTIPSSSMKMQWEKGDALKAIQKQQWNFVVLQEESLWAMFDGNLRDANQYTDLFEQAIEENGSHAVLYLTWPDKAGAPSYTGQYAAQLQNPEYSMHVLDSQTHRLADELQIPVVEVGRYWMESLNENPSIDLYQADFHHPSVAGSYLSALVFYKTFTARDVTHTTFKPDGMSDADAQILRKLVATWK